MAVLRSLFVAGINSGCRTIETIARSLQLSPHFQTIKGLPLKLLHPVALAASGAAGGRGSGVPRQGDRGVSRLVTSGTSLALVTSGTGTVASPALKITLKALIRPEHYH